MKTYLDATALFKRASDEPDSGAAREALRAAIRREDSLLTSQLAEVELSRAARQVVPIVGVAEFELECLRGVARLPVDDAVIALARRIAPKVLPTDLAIHLATAVLASADEVLTFDPQFARACRGVGLRLAASATIATLPELAPAWPAPRPAFNSGLALPTPAARTPVSPETASHAGSVSIVA